MACYVFSLPIQDEDDVKMALENAQTAIKGNHPPSSHSQRRPPSAVSVGRTKQAAQV